MADKREALLAEAIRNEVAIFTSDDILTAAGIDKQKAAELINKVDNATEEVIGEFLRKK